MSWEYRNGYDPAFFDDGWVQCDMCTAVWYHTDYEGDRCADCIEDTKEGEDNEVQIM